MIHLISLGVALLFANVLTGGAFSLIVLCANLIGLRLSASGVLGISLQIALTIISFGINFFVIDKDKYRSSINKIQESNRLSYLTSILIVVFWLYLILNDYATYGSLTLDNGLEQLKATTSVASILISWSVSLVFSVAIYFLISKMFELFKGK